MRDAAVAWAEQLAWVDVAEGIVTAVVRRPDGTIVGFIDNPNFAPG